MRIRQIGTIVFNADTNIVVDATNQDAPGIGFRVNDLYDPQPFAVEIAFRRATRQDALGAVNALARELHSYAQRRQDGRYAIAGGALVVAEDATGGATLRSYLRDGSVTLLGVEATATGVIARVRVTGTLVAPFLDYTSTTNTISSLLQYERRIVSLSGLNDAYLYKHSFEVFTSNMFDIYNALLAVEELESATGTSRITVINQFSAAGNGVVTVEDWDAGWQTLKRVELTTATNGVISYLIPPTIPQDVYRLFIEIFCFTPPGPNARYIVSWDGQPQIAETIVEDRSWYSPALFVRREGTTTLTLQIQNVPIWTLVMPLVLIPTDGVFVWSAITPPTLNSFRIRDLQSATARPFSTIPNGTVYGPPGCVSSRHIAIFNGMMDFWLNASSSANLNIYSRRIEPAAFA